jgi:hypothetical protein
VEYVFLVVGIVSAASLTLGVAFSGVAAMLYIVNRVGLIQKSS